VTIYHGDCREILPLKADLLLSDPPYPGYEKGWAVPDVAGILGSLTCTKVIFWPVLTPSPLRFHVAEHVWHKPNGQSRYQYERILVEGLAAADAKVFRVAAILPNYSQYARECVDHPTQKPLSLLIRLLSLYSGDLVVDPFMGSGTTIEACKKVGRRAIGIEIEERYCEIAAKRCAQEVLAL